MRIRMKIKMKKQKPLWRISVVTSQEAEDAVRELLASILGVAATSYFDLEKQTSLVSVFMEQGKFSPAGARREISARLKRIASFGLNIGAGKIEIARVKREDWAESWKRHFHPIEIGKTLLVKPSWSKKCPAKNQAVVTLDPGLSFGTGSGILAIAAAKLGYQPVHAFDFDPDSVRVVRENLRKNRATNQVKLSRGDVTRLPLKPARQYDLVCANLISNLLIAERWRIVNRVKRGGALVLAGILAAEFAEVEWAFAELHMRLIVSRVENEWRSGAFCFV